jgi:hypothetical protein
MTLFKEKTEHLSVLRQYMSVIPSEARTSCRYCIRKVNCALKPERLADSEVVVPMLPKV